MADKPISVGKLKKLARERWLEQTGTTEHADKGHHAPTRTPEQTGRLESVGFYGARWRRARKMYLAKHPLCKRCEGLGLLTPACVVDHVVPVRIEPSRFYDESNWQALCRGCHRIKTGQDQRTYPVYAKGGKQ